MEINLRAMTAIRDYTSGVVADGGEGQKGAIAPKFWAVGKFFFSRNIIVQKCKM